MTDPLMSPAEMHRRIEALETQVSALWLVLRVAAQRTAGQDFDLGEIVRDAAAATRLADDPQQFILREVAGAIEHEARI